MYLNVAVLFVHVKVSKKKNKKNKSTEKVIEMNKPMNNLTNDLEDC